MGLNYTPYHLHSDYSLLDSCTQYKEYIDRASELEMKAIAFSEHGKLSGWFKKMQYCKKKGIKYIHAVECYLTESLEPKIRDNYHTILIAKNMEGLKELNLIIGKSFNKDHFYYNNRISFDEFLSLSDNIITTSACLASPLNKLSKDNLYYEKLINRYDFLEIQPHDDSDQKKFNIDLACLSEQYNKPLIAGTDTHSVSKYKAECRKILMKYKRQSYGNEDNFDLVFKTYDELVDAFEKQDALPSSIYLTAIENTNVLADMIDGYDIDTSSKYPLLYGSKEADHEKFIERINTKFQEKIEKGIIPSEQIEPFKKAIDEEIRVFTKLGMDGFMLSMSEILEWCHNNGIVTGTARGSVGGSRVAYVTDIIDLNPETWGTLFSRFCNESRQELGDIDTDVIEEDRPKIFAHVIERFGRNKCARVSSFGTIADKAAIDEIGGALAEYWKEDNPNRSDSENPYSLANIKRIKKEYSENPSLARENYKEIFYYYDGMVGTKVSQSIHPAGMIISPIDLPSNYGVFDKDGDDCLFLDMDECHDLGLVKYDFLCLVNVKIIKETCEMIGKKYPKSHEIDWNDQAVWKDMLRTSSGIFQMESDFAFQLLSKLKPQNIIEMSHITAAMRPAGASYRDDLAARKMHDNGSESVNKLLEKNYGFFIYQEDVTKFLTDICGFTGSEADTIRRAIAKKKVDIINASVPKIIEGYCKTSDKPKDVAEKEAQQFIQVIQDAGDYMFNYSHSVAYCLIGYICAYLRYYHPVEFITALLNNSKDQDDITKFTELAQTYGIAITAPKYGESGGNYTANSEKHVIAKGIASVKGVSYAVADKLLEISKSCDNSHFVNVLDMALHTSEIKRNQIDVLNKIDFFDMYGNQKTVSQISRMYDTINTDNLKIKTEDISKNQSVYDIVCDHTYSMADKRGNALKYRTFEDHNEQMKCMRSIEEYLQSLNLKDIPQNVKIQNYKEYLGYVPATGKVEDRKTLIINDVTPITSKSGGVWQYRINAQSLGSGRVARLSVAKRLYDNYPIKESSIINAKEIKKDEKGYWHLTNYAIIT